MAFDAVQITSRDRRSVYTVWLRSLAFIGVFAGAFFLISPSFLFSYSNPNLPWNEETRILPSGKTATRAPSADQPKITEVLSYKTQVHQDGSPRGRIGFIVYPSGIVKGVWNGEYDSSNDAHCTILAANFAGNIDPAKPCIEGNIHDASKLYVITSGTFTLLETGNITGHNRGINGLVYVRGWLDPNYFATGELFITKNKKSYEVFSWSAAPVD